MSNSIQDALRSVEIPMPGMPTPVDNTVLDTSLAQTGCCKTEGKDPAEVVSRIFCLEYKAGQVIRSMYFVHKNADLYSAIEEAKLFCIKMRYRFIFVRRFLTALDEEVLKAQQQGRV